jgi:hypothetical protein
VVGVNQAESGLVAQLPPVLVHQVFNRLLQDMPVEIDFSSSRVSHQDVEDTF